MEVLHVLEICLYSELIFNLKKLHALHSELDLSSHVVNLLLSLFQFLQSLLALSCLSQIRGVSANVLLLEFLQLNAECLAGDEHFVFHLRLALG